jgi:hypothetical protein
MLHYVSKLDPVGAISVRFFDFCADAVGYGRHTPQAPSSVLSAPIDLLLCLLSPPPSALVRSHPISIVMSRPSVSGVLRKDTTHLRPSAAGGGSAATPKAGTLSTPAETRRRLSVMRSPGMTDGFIDGANENGQASIAALVQSGAKGSTSRSCFKSYVAKSKVGYMQFNPGKVNQDRAMEVPKVGGRDDRSLFGLFFCYFFYRSDVFSDCAFDVFYFRRCI